MHFARYRLEYQEAVLQLHRGAIAGITLGKSAAEDEADLIAIEPVYLRDGGEFLVGFIGEKLVAMGGFRRLSSASAELKRMRIAREFQGKGCGSLLLKELERIAFRDGIRTLCLATARQRSLTLSFYVKHGYQEAGRGLYGAVETIEFCKTLEV